MTGNIGDALRAYQDFRPSASSLASKRFAGKAGKHYARCFKGSKGLALVGLGSWETKSVIEFHELDDGKVEIDFMVIAVNGKEFESFDLGEALGYNHFIKTTGTAERAAEIKAKNLKLKAEQN